MNRRSFFRCLAAAPLLPIAAPLTAEAKAPAASVMLKAPVRTLTPAEMDRVVLQVSAKLRDMERRGARSTLRSIDRHFAELSKRLPRAIDLKSTRC